ncbi:phosphotransferase [Leisingera sp. F5]|uniref:phosphotransferase n=1 Tax=Leisingera sp. F5 TaxID=1813816 RepID=UPI0025B8EEA2|nr:phosphotransferase [Leisingera sp. F5]
MFPVAQPGFAGFIEELGLLGISPCGAADPGATAFAVLRANSVQRWLLVPLLGRTAVADALRMLTPMSRRARLAKSAVLALNGAGLRPVWTRNRIYLKMCARASCLHSWPSAAFFSGTPGPERKITVQLRCAHSRENAYLKLACSPHAGTLIAKEVRALQSARKLDLSSALLPSVLGYTRFGPRRAYICSDEARPGFKPARTLHQCHFGFLDEMAAKTAAEISGSYLHSLQQQHAAASNSLLPAQTGLAARGLEALRSILTRSPVAAALAHGDFTPWNCAAAGSRLYVFDWELSARQPLGWDHLHFLLSTGAASPCGDPVPLLRQMQARWHHQSPEGARFLLTAYLLDRIFRGNACPASPVMLQRLLAAPAQDAA